jgi:hypothetical protein
VKDKKMSFIRYFEGVQPGKKRKIENEKTEKSKEYEARFDRSRSWFTNYFSLLKTSIPLKTSEFHFCRSRVIGLNMTENRIFTLCHMIT